nr:THAP domain-containing protein 7 isoform X3 [Peromyscus maniculatus bairdii]
MWVRGIKLRSSRLASSAETPAALGGVPSGWSQVFLGGGSFSARGSAHEVRGALQTAPRLLRANRERSAVALDTQTRPASDRTADPGVSSSSPHSQHPVALPPGSLPVPPLEGGRPRRRSPYATNFRIGPPIARLWRRSNGQTVSARAWWRARAPTRRRRWGRALGRAGDGAFPRSKLPKKDNPRRGLWLANCQRLDPSGQGLWDPASEYIYFCSKHFEENCFELVGISCSEGQGPTAPFSPPPTDIICFPVEEASAPATLPVSPAVRLEPGLNSPFSDLLGPLGAQADEAGCSAQPSPERHASPLEPRPISPSAYMLRLPPPAGAYIQNEHSYQVGSALLWKRRAEAALDALDKAQRQLQACRRREQRLRLRLTKLQQERAREKRAQADARQTLKDHVQDFAMQLSNSMA